MSFYKTPSKVIKESVKIQSNFLWIGTDLKKSIHWVSWKNVCLEKYKGGLCIKGIETFNKSLLLKWKCRTIQESDDIWMGILKHRSTNPWLLVMSNAGKI